jgi:hypothetical protein
MTLADYKMSGWMRRVMAKLVPIICTDEASELGLVDEVVDHVELMMRSFPGFLRFSLIAGTAVFELLAMVFPSSLLRPFSRLPRAKQEKYFKMFWDSKFQLFRQLAKGLKAPIAMGYWENPVISKRMGYTPEQWIAEVSARRQRDYAKDIAYQEAMVVAPDPLVPSETLSRKVKNAKAC